VVFIDVSARRDPARLARLRMLRRFFPDLYEARYARYPSRGIHKALLGADLAYVSADLRDEERVRALASACARLGLRMALGGRLARAMPSLPCGSYRIVGEGVSSVADFAEDFMRGRARAAYAARAGESHEGIFGFKRRYDAALALRREASRGARTAAPGGHAREHGVKAEAPGLGALAHGSL